MTAASAAKTIVQDMLRSADVRTDGQRDWDMDVKDERLYSRVLSQGRLGLGEAYMDGWWKSRSIDGLIDRLVRARVEDRIPKTLATAWAWLKATVLNMQNRQRSKRVAEEHYDLGNEFYEAFLDPYNQYTCGYFKDTEDLNVAQEKKLDLQCQKLQIEKGDRVLDIGCGWGGFSKFAAERYGANVTGITISKEQAAYAREYCKGLPVEIKLQDYRDLDGQYDKVIICGMIEHVGYKNYRTIFNKVRGVLKEKGIFLLHTIGSSVSSRTSDAWITKYIFPNSMLPSVKQLAGAMEGLFVMEDWHNFSHFYDKTLMAWHKNFLAHWDRFASQYGERFKRMWEYYLLSCAGGFRARSLQLWQIVMTKNGMLGGYVSPR